MHSAQRKSKWCQYLLISIQAFSLLLQTHHRDAARAEALLGFLCFVFFSCIASFLPVFYSHRFFFVLGFCFSGRGIYILYEDVKSCPYEDVHVLWSILVESHTPLPSKNEVSFAQSWMWESFSYLQFSFLSSSSVQKNIYDVFTYIKKFSLFSGLLNHFNISSHEYSGLWMFIQRFPWL
jgi:hypothetical protein